jgi:hypothetical protein
LVRHSSQSGIFNPGEAHTSPVAENNSQGLSLVEWLARLPDNSGYGHHVRSGAAEYASARVDSHDRLVDSQLDSRPSDSGSQVRED